VRMSCVRCLQFFTIAICLVLVPDGFAQQQYRTVIDKEVGSIFQQPNGFPWSDYGAFVGSTPPNVLDPSSIQVFYGRFDQFAPSDPSKFPYAALRTYEAEEVSAGRPPIFVSATYMGKSRPVLFSWSLGLVNGVPTAPQRNWQYAVNVQDDRFIHFWINQYIRPVLWQPVYAKPNVWFELDQCAFIYALYGILDDNNKFVAGVPWDSPFPTDDSAYFNSIATFFNRLKQLAPDIQVMPNVGTISDPTQFQTVFANVPGAMLEDVYAWHATPTAYTRDAWYAQKFNLFPWLGSQGRVAIMRALIPSGDPNALLTSFVVYSLLKGPNFFFAPGTATGSTNINPSQWEGMKALLGNPLSAMQSQQQPGKDTGYRLFWRNYANGIVYLNWTGSTQTITLNSKIKYWDPNGTPVTQIQIPDANGTFVTNLHMSWKVLPPRISPRYASPVTSPFLATMESDTPNTVIHYTLDGTTPKLSSPIYTDPVQLTSSTVVQARAYVGGDPSFPSSASYTVSSSALPTVQFTMASDSGPAGTYYPVLSLTAVPAGTVSVGYRVQQPNGSTATGTATFLPGETYRYFPITTTGAENSLTKVTITGATGAAIGPT
jgi:hypothetical protein